MAGCLDLKALLTAYKTEAVVYKQLTKNFGLKCPAIKYLQAVVYCSTSEIRYQYIDHESLVHRHSLKVSCGTEVWLANGQGPGGASGSM